MRKKFFIISILICLFTIGVFAESIKENRNGLEVLKGKVTEIEKYGHALLDITIEKTFYLGYELGDSVNVVFDNGYTLTDIPLFDGYYVDRGMPLLRAYPTHKNIAVCINYGKLNEEGNINVNDKVTISLNQKGKYLADELLNSLVYSNERKDYSSDSEFANFREIKIGAIKKDRLFRSASPIDNANNRASYANNLMASVIIRSVLNLADTEEDVKQHINNSSFDSNYYLNLFESGSVITLGLPIDYYSDSFGETLVSGIKKLSDMPTPYLIHCTEGKDRAGFASALLEALSGCTEDEIITDYMESFKNYYKITKENNPEKYNAIVDKNIVQMLNVIKGTNATLETGAYTYLKKYGMTDDQIINLIYKLTY